MLNDDITNVCVTMVTFFVTAVGLMQQIYEAAAKQKSWDSFTKAQRKTIMQWKEHATVRKKKERGGGGDGTEHHIFIHLP